MSGTQVLTRRSFSGRAVALAGAAGAMVGGAALAACGGGGQREPAGPRTIAGPKMRITRGCSIAASYHAAAVARRVRFSSFHPPHSSSAQGTTKHRPTTRI